MTCEEMPRVIDAYLDGELSVAATLRAHEHFAACETCRRILESEAALHGLLVQASRAEAVPDGLRSNILCALPAGEPARPHPARRLAIRFGVVSGFIGLAGDGAVRAASDDAAGRRAGEQAPALRRRARRRPRARDVGALEDGGLVPGTSGISGPPAGCGARAGAASRGAY